MFRPSRKSKPLCSNGQSGPTAWGRTPAGKGRHDRGITLVEVLVVGALIALIIILLAPVIDHIHAQSLITECGNNLRMICAAMELYQLRHESWLPANQADGSWRTYLDPDLRSPFVPDNWKGSSPMWKCPAGGEYFANNLILGDNRYDRSLYRTHWKVSMFPRPTRVPVITDARPGDFANAAIGGFEGVDFRHAAGAVFLFLDCRVEWVRKAEVADVEKWWKEPVRGQYKPDEPETGGPVPKTGNPPAGDPPAGGP